jgi:MFS family permease
MTATTATLPDEPPRSTPLLVETGQQQQQRHVQDTESQQPSTQVQYFDDISQLTLPSNLCCCCCGSHACCSEQSSCLYRWWTECAWPGLGLFGESYLLFSIGILKPLWQELYPTCFTYETCSARLLRSLTYSVVLGIITGMLVVGYLANSMGRRRGSLLTATLMSGGAIGLTVVAWGGHHMMMNNNPARVFQCMSILLFIFGIGVGGEYPLSASSASERAMEELRKRRQQEEEQQEMLAAADNANAAAAAAAATEPTPPPALYEAKNSLDQRGQRIQLVFTMQGAGIFINTIIMAALLLLTGQSGTVYNNDKLHLVWRITYAIGAVTLLFVLVSRFMFLSESHVWEQDRQDRLQETQQATTYPTSTPSHDAANPDASSASFVAMKDDGDAPPHEQQLQQQSPFSLLLQHYGVRLLGTSLCWLLWDVAFYGNKLFQSAFLLALTGADNTTLFQFCLAAALNAGVALLGYIGAALLVDRLGRQVLQTCGLFITGSLFVLCGAFHAKLQSSSWWLVVLYLGSSYFGQLGPNCTTFLIPAEIFPTALRTTCHGISAASGKVGALLAAVLFGYMKRDVTLFIISGICCFIAGVISMYTLPESKGLDLYEIDKKWHLTLQGKQDTYVGPASAPPYLSFYERRQRFKQQE